MSERWTIAVSTSTSSAAGREGAECGGESGLSAGGVGVSLGIAGRSGIVKPRQAKRGGGNDEAKETPKRRTR